MPADLYECLKTDYKVVDGTESITYVSVLTAGNTSVTVANADTDELNSREVAASGGYFQEGDMRFRIWRTQLSTVTPKPGDYITRTSNSTTWEVLSATLDDLTIAYEIVARKAR